MSFSWLNLPGFFLFDSSFSNLELSMGVMVMAANADAPMVMVTIQPNCWNITPIMPDTMVIGKNTAIMVMVAAITASQTSFVAYIDASRGVLPRSMCLLMFSNTTMASSTTIPMAMESADNEIMLMVLPETSR